MDELLDLYRVDARYRRVEWVDGFDGMDAIVRYLQQNPDHENPYYVTDIGNNIRAMAFFTALNLLLLTSGGEVVRDGQASG